MSVYKKLLDIQTELKAPKNQKNTFGNYNYRSAEDVLEALKPLLLSNNVTVIIDDEIVNVGNRFYIKAKVKFIDFETGESIETTAFAREPENKKGYDESQITGSASSYARKYALNGMFCIDDTKDSDATNTGDKKQENKKPAYEKPKNEPPKQTTTAPQKPDSDPDHGLRLRLAKMCLEMSGDNKDEAQKLIGLYSEFTNDKGEAVQNKDYKKLKGKWLKSTYGKAKKDYIETYSEKQFSEKYQEDTK